MFTIYTEVWTGLIENHLDTINSNNVQDQYYPIWIKQDNSVFTMIAPKLLLRLLKARNVESGF